MKQYYHIGCLIFLLFCSCTCFSQINLYNNNSNIFDSCKHLICSDNKNFGEWNGFKLANRLYKLNSDEIVLLDSLILESTKNYNANLIRLRFNGDTMTEDSAIIVTSSIFLLYPFNTLDNQKLVLIKYRCKNSNDDPKINICEWDVFGGGNCYFSLWINLTERKFYKLSVNAPK